MIYVTGDTHGDESRLSTSRLKALRKDDTLVICGDFGFVWDNSKKEQKFLQKLSKRNYNICFIDGAHENFELLNSYPIITWNNGNARQISSNIFHLMRGQTYEIDGLKVFTMGGGETPDIDLRIEGTAWSRAEIPTQEELLEGIAKIEEAEFKADIIITHEPPTKVKEFLKLQDSEPVRITALNAYLEEFSALCKYQKWYFGSMHIDKFISSSQVAVFKNVIEAMSGKKV